MDFLFLLLGLVLGFAIGYLLLRNKGNGEKEQVLIQQVNQLERDFAVARNNVESLSKDKEQLAAEKEDSLRNVLKLTTELSSLKTQNETLVKNIEEKQKEFEKNQEQLRIQFENLANKILDEKSKKFSEQNRTQLDIILNPLKDKISDFEKKVESTYQTESKERISLQEQVKQLMSLNTQLNDEAQKLSRALKSDSKKQGNWGEFILEKILEYSGLVKDREYVTQYSTTDENNTRLQPDVVISLPDNKHLVIDSKVSLTAYERLVNAEDDVTRELALREHLASIRSHIKNLSEKNYNNASGINSPDFVLLFMPIESSFGVAVEADNQLFKYAWEQKIVVVSPSTLLATLKTVHSLWRQEKQNINAVRIATDAGNLYDKFAGLVDDLVKLGNQLKTVQGTYDASFNKLKAGSGNIIGRIEKIRKLGAKTSKKISPNLTDEAMDFFDDEHEEEQEQKVEE